MTAWDREHPERCDLNALDALLDHLVCRVLPELTETADRADAARTRAGAEWTGQASDAWQSVTAERIAAVRDTQVSAQSGTDTLHAFATTIREITTPAANARDDLAYARAQLGQAETHLIELREDDAADAFDLRLALNRVDSWEEEVRLAWQTLDRLGLTRQEADQRLRDGLTGVLPVAWTAGGGLTSTLPPDALADGTATLAAWVRGLPEGAQGDAAARWLAGQLSDQDLEALLNACPALAARLMTADPGEFATQYPALADALDVVDPDERIAAVMAACTGMSTHELGVLSRSWPGVVNNLDGMPLWVRIVANRVAVRAAMLEVDVQITHAEAQIEAITGNSPLENAMRDEFERAIDRLRQTQEWYEQLLHESTSIVRAGADPLSIVGHQVVLFDPDQNRFGELLGDAAAPNIGILVGGTSTNLQNMDKQFDRAWDFVVGAAGDLAMITYLGGPMPQSVFWDAIPGSGAAEAADSAYARAIGPHLASFGNGIKAVTGATVTAVGHSYGGSVVGAAETAGLIVDRIVHVESAGAGPGVSSIQDYAAPDTPRFTMTAPGDLIGLSQGVSAGPLGHGLDPDALPQVTRLETGRVDRTDPSSPLLEGPGSHSGVFGDSGSATKPDAWQNILSVMRGGEVSIYTEPTQIVTPTWGGATIDYDYPMADPRYVPPTEQVP